MIPTRSRASQRLLIASAIALVLAGCSGGGGGGGSSGSGASPATTPAFTAAPSGTAGAAASTTGGATACSTAPTPDAADIPTWQTATGDPSVFPTLVSSQQACGANRFLFGFIDRQNKPVSQPERSASVAFYNLGRDPERPVATVTGRFQWLLDGQTGIYVADVEYPEAGEWGAEFVTSVDGGTPEVIRARFQVQPDGLAPGIGDPAPATKTPTLADVGGDVLKISSDTEPEPSLYEISVDQALAQHRPFVVAFATPAFCRSRTCGPMLDVIKALAQETTGVAFINVEPYQLEFRDGRLQPVLSANNQLQPTEATLTWKIPSEPWTFVVDRDGIVRASFEATVSHDELKAAVDAVK